MQAFGLVFLSAYVITVPCIWTPTPVATTPHPVGPSASSELLHRPRTMNYTIPPTLYNPYRASIGVVGRGEMMNTQSLHLATKCIAAHNRPYDCVGVSRCLKTGRISFQYYAATSHQWAEGNETQLKWPKPRPLEQAHKLKGCGSTSQKWYDRLL